MKSIGNRLKTWRQNTSKFLIPKYAREAAGGSFSAYVQKCVQAPTLFENLDESNQKIWMKTTKI